MKSFLKMFLASCLGIVVGLMLLVVVLIGVGSIAGMNSDKIDSDGILLLDFAQVFTEKTGNIEVNVFDDSQSNNIGLQDFKRLLGKAKEDSGIKGILIKAADVPLGKASMLSVMKSLKEFKESGKFIYSYADYYTQSNYFLSTVADSIFLNPNGMIDVRGYSTMIPFFKEGLDKLGVKFDIFYAGDFKSATEPFRRTDMSEPNRIQTKEFLEEMLAVMLKEVGENRKLTSEQLEDILNNYSGRTPEIALEAGMIDGIRYWSEVTDMLKEKVGKSAKKRIDFLSFNEFKKLNPIVNKGPSNKKIAVVYAEGNIGYGKHQKGTITEKEYVKILTKLRLNSKVKAIVLRVNSGGGSALTSDIIWNEVERCKKAGKKVVASFGDYAASGGYYIAAGADTIVASPNTLTGSIGVFSMLPNAKRLFSDKLGITFDTVTTHDMALGYNGIYELSQKEREFFEESTDNVYDRFLDRVSQGRSMTKEEVHQVAQGRVWTGEKGKELGLVDVIGELNDAIEIAAEMSELEDYKIVEYPYIKVEFIDQLISELTQGMNEDASIYSNLSKESKKMIELYKDHKELLEMEGVQARLPYRLN